MISNLSGPAALQGEHKSHSGGIVRNLCVENITCLKYQAMNQNEIDSQTTTAAKDALHHITQSKDPSLEGDMNIYSEE